MTFGWLQDDCGITMDWLYLSQSMFFLLQWAQRWIKVDMISFIQEDINVMVDFEKEGKAKNTNLKAATIKFRQTRPLHH